MSKTNQMKLWMDAATTEEQLALAKAVGTSRAYLYALAASEDAAHHRTASAEMGGLIEAHTAKMRVKNKALPVVYRSDLVEACANCPFAQQCLGVLATRRADFTIKAPRKSTAKPRRR